MKTPEAFTADQAKIARRAAHRFYVENVLDETVASILADDLEITEDDNRQSVPYGDTHVEEGGLQRFVGEQTVVIEVDAEALLGWYSDRGRWFHGDVEACDYRARVTKVKRAGRGKRSILELTLDVESD